MKPSPQCEYWYPNQAWLMVHKPSASKGSRVWNRIIVAWKKIVKHIELTPPTNMDEVLNTSLGWATNFIGSNFNFSPDRARHLARAGMRTIGDLWDHHALEFISWEVLSNKFPLLPLEQHHWFYLIYQIPPKWLDYLQVQPFLAYKGDWLGIFPNPDSTLLLAVWKNMLDLNPILLIHAHLVPLAGDEQLAVINLITRQLSLSTEVIEPATFHGFVKRIRVLELSQGRHLTSYLLFVGTIQSMPFDPRRWRWRNGMGLMDYSTARGWKLLNSHTHL